MENETTKLTYNAVYADGSFGKITLGELINKGGASGKIHLVENKPESVAKIFHNLAKSKTNRQKLEQHCLQLLAVGLGFCQIMKDFGNAFRFVFHKMDFA